MAPVQSKQSKTTLLALPRELRDIIYEYAVFEEVEIFSSDREPPNRRTITPGLPASCKQLHEETISLYYQNSTFIIKRSFTAHMWLRHLPAKYRDLIREIRHTRYCHEYNLLFHQPREKACIGDVGVNEVLQDLKSLLVPWGIKLKDGVLSSWEECNCHSLIP